MKVSPRQPDRLVGVELVEDPYPFYEQLRQVAPVWRLPQTDAFLVSSWNLVTEAAGRVEDFSNHFRHSLFSEDDGTLGVIDNCEGGAPDVFAGADPPVHTAHRKVFFPELVQTRMDRLEPGVVALADQLLDELLRRECVDSQHEWHIRAVQGGARLELWMRRAQLIDPRLFDLWTLVDPVPSTNVRNARPEHEHHDENPNAHRVSAPKESWLYQD
jgi:hypothetical protein